MEAAEILEQEESSHILDAIIEEGGHMVAESLILIARAKALLMASGAHTPESEEHYEDILVAAAIVD